VSYTITVGIKGDEKYIEALDEMLDKAVEGTSSIKEFNDFFSEIGLSENPFGNISSEFSFEEPDLENEIDDPYPFFDALAENFPQLSFYCISDENTENGNGVTYNVYKNGSKVDEDHYFYDGTECSTYECTYVPANAIRKWVKASYDLWRIEDGNDKDAIAEAQKAKKESREQWAVICDFMFDGGIEDCLETATDTYRSSGWGYSQYEAFGSYIHIILLLDNEGGYGGYSITNIETVDFTGEELDELPDLSRFTSMKTLILTDNPDLEELPSYIIEKVQSGEVEVIGFNEG